MYSYPDPVVILGKDYQIDTKALFKFIGLNCEDYHPAHLTYMLGCDYKKLSKSVCAKNIKDFNKHFLPVDEKDKHILQVFT